jgi:hypothetical protein
VVAPTAGWGAALAGLAGVVWRTAAPTHRALRGEASNGGIALRSRPPGANWSRLSVAGFDFYRVVVAVTGEVRVARPTLDDRDTCADSQPYW